MSNDVSKLPKWAQDQIKVLEMRNEELEREVQQLSGDAEATNITYSSLMRNRPLPSDVSIRFHTKNGWVDFRHERGGVYVNAERLMDIRPEAANVVRVYCTDRY